MSINAHCGSCNRELLLGQLVPPNDGFWFCLRVRLTPLSPRRGA